MTEIKHMFGNSVDIEQMFGQYRTMNRTNVRPRNTTASRFRRRRLAAAGMLVLLVALVVGPVAHASGSGEGDLTTPYSSVRYVVRSGDTLWSIATEQAPGRDPRPLVAAIEQVNRLEAGELVPGKGIDIPVLP